MSATDTDASPQVTARVAGFLYLVVIIGGAFAELGVRQRLVETDDPATTASNILSQETLFRWGFAADLIALLCVMPLIMLLYELLKIVNHRVALVALFFSLVGSGMQAASLLGQFAALVLLKRGESFGVNAELLRAQTYMALQLQGVGYAMALTFFGGTMLARGYLVYHSTFLPRIIGVFLAFEGACFLANGFATFVAPGTAGAVLAILLVSGLAEVILCLWLLIRGVNVPQWHQQALMLAHP